MNRTHVDLFSGIGGFALAARWAGVQTVAFAEIDDYASRVLAKNFSGVTNYGDVRNVPGIQPAWLVTGGFPCQPFSVAGKRKGTSDDRWLWPEMAGVIERVRPTWVLGENVPGIVRMELDTVLFDLERVGYTTTTFVIPAVAVNAPHRRDRVWIVAYANGGRLQQCDKAKRAVFIADTFSDVSIVGACRWATEPDVGRVANGIPNRVDRLRGLGNAIVPQVAYQLIRMMIAAEETQP